MHSLWQDLRYAVRLSLKQPGFSLTVILILALGIGANTAIFSFVHGMLLRPLPYPSPEGLVYLWSQNLPAGMDRDQVSLLDWRDWNDRSRLFEGMAAYTPAGATIDGPQGRERIPGLFVSPNLFPMLGVEAHLGRTFSAEEAQPGGSPVALLSYDLWQSRFGGDPSIIGRPLLLSATSTVVVGVLPEGFVFPSRLVGIWRPLAFDPESRPRSVRWVHVLGRIKQGVSFAQARQEMQSIALELERESPQTNRDWRVGMMPLHEAMAGDSRVALLVLQAVVGLVLLIASVNVAGLFLARSQSRRREIAVRAALGAGRVRLLRQLLAESLVLALAGGAAGLAASLAATRWIGGLIPSDLNSNNYYEVLGRSFPRLHEVGIDFEVLLMGLALAFLTAMVFGVVPLLQGSASGQPTALTESSRTIAGSSRQILRRLLVATQVALALVLLAGAGLLTRSFANMLQVSPGFEPKGILTIELSLGSYRTRAQKIQFGRDLVQGLSSLPEVESVGFTTNMPFKDVDWREQFTIVDREVSAGSSEAPSALLHLVSSGYFSTLKIPLIRGRLFDSRDRQDAPGVALINETLARRHWPAGSPLGEHLRLEEGGPSLEIVGIVGDTLQAGLDEQAVPQLFVPFEQRPSWFMNVALRTLGSPIDAAGPARAKIAEVAPRLAVEEMSEMDSLIATSMSQRRLAMSLTAAFAVLALALAATGIFGLNAYFVAQRRQEVGIRMALGAPGTSIVSMVMAQGLRLSLWGVALGLPSAILLGRLASGFLFDVSAADPLTLGIVAALLLSTAGAAGLIPAMKASRIDPASTLKGQ